MSAPGEDDDRSWWDRFLGRSGNEKPVKQTYGSTSSLSTRTQRHLQSVYTNLALTSMAAAAASYLFTLHYLPDPGSWFLLPMFGSMFSVLLLPSSYSITRHAALYTFGLANGWGIGPMLRTLLLLDPGVPLMALVGTTAIFLSFSLTALMTERRSQLYLGGFLSAAMLSLAAIGLLNTFIGSEGLFSAELYLGLLALAGYTVFDTQVMVEQAEAGQTDVPRDALNLFTNIVGIFVRLLIILSRQNDEDRRKRKRRD